MTRKEINAAQVTAGVKRVYHHEDLELSNEYGKKSYLFRVLGLILDEKIDQIPTTAA